MILGIDIGNTSIVCGVIDDLNNNPIIRINTHNIDDYIKLTNFNSITDIIISSVVPSVNDEITKILKECYNLEPIFVSNTMKSNISIKIKEPLTLGSDLFVDCVSAVNKYNTPIIIIDLGTATKILVVNDNKEFIGGSIAPGVNTSLNSLINKAELLDNNSFKEELSVVGDDTSSCLGSGVIIGTACMIDGMIDRIIKDKELNNPSIILTGGLSKHINKYLKHKVILDDNLLLDGLLVLYRLNK